MLNVPEKQIWVDNRLGANGRWAWYVPLFILVLFYQLFIAIKFLFYRGIYGEAPLVAVVGILVLLFLLIGAINFCRDSPRIAQSIIFENEKIVIRFYLGRQQIYKRSEIELIKNIKIYPYFRIITLFDLKKDNYKIKTKEGDYFYISGAMPMNSSLLQLLSRKIEN
ncbi:hypothetical protein [Desulfurivibrio alkaliphilus]|uniref:hypothetical protein n=1 Tax=Desulfurivibrio alkaliphilus TaxID=427923 RepID=UPI0012FEBA96|nr:hypothetical protein [Desulfurivibrio alkaliphilus]